MPFCSEHDAGILQIVPARRYSLTLLHLVFGTVACIGLGMWMGLGSTVSGYAALLPAGSFRLISSAFADTTLIPSDYTCDGKNVHPPLTIENVPQGTKSLALVVDDPDHIGGSRLHWDVWNISPEVTEIPAGVVPSGALAGMTDFGVTDYRGPCQADTQVDHYIFHLYALNASLDLLGGSERVPVAMAIQQHLIAATELTGLYQK
jgi:Raf kinase inhibitor-like YbhB/YbcL family protein